LVERDEADEWFDLCIEGGWSEVGKWVELCSWELVGVGFGMKNDTYVYPSSTLSFTLNA
jgi:hypothetical protein